MPGLRRDDWPLPGPKGQPAEKVRESREQLQQHAQLLPLKEGRSRTQVDQPAQLAGTGQGQATSGASRTHLSRLGIRSRASAAIEGRGVDSVFHRSRVLPLQRGSCVTARRPTSAFAL